MQEPQINPWSSTPSLDIGKAFADFGIEPIAPVISDLPDIPYFMRRGIVVGHRDYLPIVQAIRNRMPFHILTGFMPSGHPHLGHLMVMKEVVWHVQQGGNGYVTIADREAHAVREMPWEKCREYRERVPRLPVCSRIRGADLFPEQERPAQGPCVRGCH